MTEREIMRNCGFDSHLELLHYVYETSPKEACEPWSIVRLTWMDPSSGAQYPWSIPITLLKSRAMDEVFFDLPTTQDKWQLIQFAKANRYRDNGEEVLNAVIDLPAVKCKITL